MHVIPGITAIKAPFSKSIVTIGNFDGVHCGHQEIFRLLLDHARRIGGSALAMSFRPHPQVILNPGKAPLLLNTYDEKRDLLAATGIDCLVEEPFSREFSENSPEQFVEKVLLGTLGARVLYLGYDFAFGRGRSGSAETLRHVGQSHGLEVHVVPAFSLGGLPVSSSRIRAALDLGAMEEVTSLLGRYYFVRGLVWRGNGRGKTIGFPTANLQLEKRKLPRIGVYVSRVKWRGKTLPSITNVGRNPTFTGQEGVAPVVVETHIFDFATEIYGDTIDVEFFHFLRPEQKFESVGALVEQIGRDCVRAREFHKI